MNSEVEQRSRIESAPIPFRAKFSILSLFVSHNYVAIGYVVLLTLSCVIGGILWNSDFEHQAHLSRTDLRDLHDVDYADFIFEYYGLGSQDELKKTVNVFSLADLGYSSVQNTLDTSIATKFITLPDTTQFEIRRFGGAVYQIPKGYRRGMQGAVPRNNNTVHMMFFPNAVDATPYNAFRNSFFTDMGVNAPFGVDYNRCYILVRNIEDIVTKFLVALMVVVGLSILTTLGSKGICSSDWKLQRGEGVESEVSYGFTSQYYLKEIERWVEAFILNLIFVIFTVVISVFATYYFSSDWYHCKDLFAFIDNFGAQCMGLWIVLLIGFVYGILVLMAHTILSDTTAGLPRMHKWTYHAMETNAANSHNRVRGPHQ